MHILLVAPYFGGSHRAWAQGYAQHSCHRVELVTMPARFWKWRMQGGAATLAELLRGRDGPRPDALLATDMVHLPALLGLARRELSDVPAVLYCHENQLTYPLRDGESRDLGYAMVNWLSMLAADRVLFNSRFHLESWFEAAEAMLAQLPDCSHVPFVAGVRAKSQVLPVGVSLSALDASLPQSEGGLRVGAAGMRSGCLDRTPTLGRASKPPLILWNQRWEYDKDPITFFRALDVLVARDVRFRVALAGSNVQQMAQVFDAARDRLGDRVVHYGKAGREAYHRLLWDADIVVSTAAHEFFGIAIAEAVYCEAFPILPRQLAYPELLSGGGCDACFYDDFVGLVDRLSWALDHVDAAGRMARQLRPLVAQYDWSRLAPVYDALLAQVAGL